MSASFGLRDIFERPFDGEDDPRIRVAQAITRAEAEAILEHRGDLILALSAPSPVVEGQGSSTETERGDGALPVPSPTQSPAGWQDISTAPKDGTRALFYGIGARGEPYMDVTAWPKGWSALWPIAYMAYADGKEPTHWQPLPKSPAESGADVGTGRAPRPELPATAEPPSSSPPQATNSEVERTLSRRAYVMSEPHLSGHRVVIGFESREHAMDAHEAVARLAQQGEKT